MNVSLRRVWAIVHKELREYRRTRSLIVGMAIFPLIFTIQPFVAVIANELPVTTAVGPPAPSTYTS